MARGPEEVAGGQIARRLAAPADRPDLGALAARWFHQVIIVRTARPPDMPVLTLLNRVRGAWGGRLMAGASASALAGRPCSFEPPCALDVFLREQLRLDGGRHGLPKPYVIGADLHRRHLDLRLTLFGFSCDWLPAAREALVAALAHDVDLAGGRRGLTVEGVDLATVEGLALPPAPRFAALDFATPFDATGADVFEAPWTLVARLARRVDGLARWMDAEPDCDWPALAQAWRGIAYGGAHLAQTDARRASRRQDRRFANPVVEGVVTLEGDLAALWPLLVIGQTCHVGRGATAGQGRYRLAA